jgi:hypothetical protein
MVSFKVVSEIAIVPDRECNTPTFTGQSAKAGKVPVKTRAVVAARIL